MNQILNKSPLPKRTHFPYLTRQDSLLSEQVPKTCIYNKYTLNSILSPNFNLFSIYLHFFHSPYKKNKETVSIFYVTFCKHICIHYEMLEEIEKIEIKQMLTQFFPVGDQRENNQEQSRVKKVTRQCLTEALREVKSSRDDFRNKRNEKLQDELRKDEQSQIQKQQNERMSSKDYRLEKESHQQFNRQQAQNPKINKKTQQQRMFWLQKKKQNFKNTLLYIEQNLQKVKQQELSPFQSIQQSSFAPYIKALFRNLNNIHVLLHLQKVKMYKYMLNYGLIFKPPLLEFPFKITKDNKDEEQKNIKIQQFFTLKKTIQKNPILTSLKSYLKRAKNRNNFINNEIVKDLIFEMNNFRKDYRLIFPQIQSKRMLMDQKSLKLTYEESYLIHQCFGVAGQTYSPQLTIVFSPTPQPFNYQKSPFEYSKQYEQSRLQKYYISADAAASQQSFNKFKDDRQLIKVKKFQNGHVWRIISLIFLIFNTQNQKIQFFSNRCYRLIHPNEKVSFKHFLQSNWKMINSIQKGHISLFQALGLKQESQFIKNQRRNGFNFTMKELMSIFNVKEYEQSQQQKIQISKFLYELEFRISIYNQIAQILTKQIKEKSFSNLNKYRIIFLLGSISFLHYFCSLTRVIKNQIIPLKKHLLTPLNINQMKLLHHFDNIFGSIRKIEQKILSMKTAKRAIYPKFQENAKQIIPKVEKYKKIWQKLMIIYNTYQIQKNEIRKDEYEQLPLGQINRIKNCAIFEEVIKNVNLYEKQSIECLKYCCQCLTNCIDQFKTDLKQNVKYESTLDGILRRFVVVLCNLFMSMRDDNIHRFDEIRDQVFYTKFKKLYSSKDKDQNNWRYEQNLVNLEQRLTQINSPVKN